ncbi:putative non-specific serine/threonine protein kinase [Helianthus debilis subsp. tardiflorus]
MAVVFSSLLAGFCGLLNLQELDLQENMFNGNIPECFNTLSSLKMFDISSNLFTGTLSPSLMANLTSLQYVDFSYNKFEGPFSFSSFSNHTKLKVVKFISDNDMFVDFIYIARSKLVQYTFQLNEFSPNYNMVSEHNALDHL